MPATYRIQCEITKKSLFVLSPQFKKNKNSIIYYLKLIHNYNYNHASLAEHIHNINAFVLKLDIILGAIGNLELKLVGRKFGETIEGIKLFGILESGFEHPQEKTGDVISSLTIGEEAI